MKSKKICRKKDMNFYFHEKNLSYKKYISHNKRDIFCPTNKQEIIILFCDYVLNRQSLQQHYAHDTGQYLLMFEGHLQK